ncbi:hypothetical protein [Arsenicicoccus bolidensis]|uniref:hypothetical protein n=1 Tax=Arsenicicoccus bolidensis TaxID=229480 RepID=UPI00040B37C4|nr:hypothetical protein [Arsenicicoccus bolidensis]
MAVCRLPPPVPILSAAVWRRSRDLAALGLGSVLVFAVPHAAYHLVHGSGDWLDAGLGPSVGAYGRKQGSTVPRLAYNRFQCAPGLLWLAEALGEDPDTVRRAIAAVEAGPARGASQCRAVREVIPWERIEALAAPHLTAARRADARATLRRGTPQGRRVRTPRVAGRSAPPGRRGRD